ncbi:MAG: extracellular solute-binding protein [Chloroflexi bacterium]|nr:extracellular solute-binding protein [Chloroflexota bacterium]
MRKVLGVAAALVIAVGAIGSAGPPPAAGTIVDARSARLTIWHNYVAGSAEEWAFQTVLAAVRPRFPNVRFTVVRQAFGDLYARFEADPAHGPDLFISSNDRLGTEVRAGLLRDVTAAVESRVASLTTRAREGARIAGRFYMIPESTKVLALYYRPGRVAAVPATTDALLEAVRGGLRLGFVADSYFVAGFFPAFGGRIIDSTYRCVADRTPGVADALAYLRRLELDGATAYTIGHYGQMEGDFEAGRLDAIIDGNWIGAELRAAVGPDLGLALLPSGPAGASRPMVSLDGWFVNARRPNAAFATKVALALSDRAAQRTWATNAVHVPADALVTSTDPLGADFAKAVAAGRTRPTGSAIDAYWQPFRTAVEKVVLGGANAPKAVRTACSAMNAANGR